VLTTVIAVVVVLGGLIFFHELGHFAVARGLGMGVSTFSLGFGPKILKYRKGKTEYALSLVPLGGYVALVGESDPKDIPEGFTEAESFALRPAWQRLLVVAAGPAANIILAWLLCWALALGWGTPILLPQVGAVVQNGPADKAGIQPGDTIVSINGVAVANWQVMADAISQSDGKTLEVTLSRPDMAPQADAQTKDDEVAQPEQGMIISVELTPERSIRKTIFGEEESAWLIGIRNSGAVRLERHGFAGAAVCRGRTDGRHGFADLAELCQAGRTRSSPGSGGRAHHDHADGGQTGPRGSCRPAGPGRPHQHKPWHPQPVAHTRARRRADRILPLGNGFSPPAQPALSGLRHARGHCPAGGSYAAGDLQRPVAYS